VTDGILSSRVLTGRSRLAKPALCPQCTVSTQTAVAVAVCSARPSGRSPNARVAVAPGVSQRVDSANWRTPVVGFHRWSTQDMRWPASKLARARAQAESKLSKPLQERGDPLHCLRSEQARSWVNSLGEQARA